MHIIHVSIGLNEAQWVKPLLTSKPAMSICRPSVQGNQFARLHIGPVSYYSDGRLSYTHTMNDPYIEVPTTRASEI